MAKNYHPQDIEPKWQKRWEKVGPPKAVDPPSDSEGKKFYALVEFPYPSGEGIHMGHTFTMTIHDVLVRKKRMEGFNVLNPMGWDAFGLPTENYAIRTGIHPAVATQKNTDQFRKQMKRLAFAYNWKREVNTSDPDYYRWTQWIFLQFFKHGLAYKASTPVGWCPNCKIILANEEIVAGKCERCGANAEYRMQKQWLLKITKYADRLADELDLVDYPDYVKASQRNWIGRTEGININYPIINSQLSIECYSTRPETNFGATFVVIAPEHPIVASLLKLKNQNAKLKTEIKNYIKQSRSKSELERTELVKDKTGVFTGSYALNRLTGKKMPIWVSDFVVLTAGTGIVVGVPAHDERDFAFAKKYGLEIIPVVRPSDSEGKWDFAKAPFVDIDKAEVFNSDFLDGLPVLKAKEKIIDYLVKKGWGKRAVNYHLRDWIFSRQHYWGEPIPMIFCRKCAQKGVGERQKMPGWFSVPEKDLPVKLPKVEKYQPTDTGESPLANIKSWVNVKCPQCGAAARRETDTMPNWAGSSWYYLRYVDPKNQKQLANRQKLNYWLPVDLYLGGAEHTTLHLLYSRFWHKFLNDIKVVPGKEPYAARRQHGVILGEDGFKMSKSRGNVVNPGDVVEKFGADTLRLYLMFMGPYDSTMPWSTKGLEGCWRFLNRVWRLVNQPSQPKTTNHKTDLERLRHQTIKKVTEDIEELKHNTAIATIMEYVNKISNGKWQNSNGKWQNSNGKWQNSNGKWQNSNGMPSKEALETLVLLLAPFAPFITEELWCEVLGNKYSVHQQPWPKYDPKLVKEEQVTIIIQVNGKVRGQIKVPSAISNAQSEIEKLAIKEANVAKHLANKKIKKVIFVPGRLINFYEP